ncbi:MAG: MerR family transcriptional regulator [Proteobacteria bacterium]|nr:MerR family transcriptional regulator [Pseudomonadota bacterium]
MNPSAAFLSPSEAARRLKISVKALRLYERRGLLTPARTSAGWRAYGPEQMARAHELLAMRRLGLGHAQIKALLDLPLEALEASLASHQAGLEGRMAELGAAVARVRAVRADLAAGRAPAAGDLEAVARDGAAGGALSLTLPWPWNGEAFDLEGPRPITWLIGPMGSGKTRFADRLEASLAGARAVQETRLDEPDDRVRDRLKSDPALTEAALALLGAVAEAGGLDARPWLAPEPLPGNAPLEARALVLLAEALCDPVASGLIVHMPEYGLGGASQRALARVLRHRARGSRCGPSLFLMTRSAGMLDLAQAGPDEAVLFFPPNHSLPRAVIPLPGSPGYEAMALCLAEPGAKPARPAPAPPRGA